MQLCSEGLNGFLELQLLSHFREPLWGNAGEGSCEAGYLVHQQLGHLHVVVEGSQVQCCVTVVLLLIYDPRPWKFR